MDRSRRVLGAVAGPAVLTLLRIRDPRVRGLALGSVSHGIGTGRLLHDDETQGAFSQDARNWLAQHGYDEAMGARPMARLIQEQIKRPLAEELLFGKLTKGGRILVSAADEGLKLDIEEAALV